MHNDDVLPPKRDEWGNDFHPPYEAMPFKIERACDPKKCKTHVTVLYSVEQDVPVVNNPMELMQAIMTGQEVPTSKQWVPVLRVLSAYN